MHTYFYWGTKVDNFLFKGCSVDSNAGLAGICLLIFVMAFLFEYLRYVQTLHKQRELKLRVKQLKLLCPTESASLLQRTVTDPTNPLNITLFDRACLFGTEVTLWLTLQNLGYFIMLSVMMYDAWFLVAAVLGGGLGYFIFGQQFMKVNIQNCQLMRSAFCTEICGELEAANQEGQSTPVADDTPSTSQGSLFAKYVDDSGNEVKVKAQCH